MEVKTFIEKAIEGGWKFQDEPEDYKVEIEVFNVYWFEYRVTYKIPADDGKGNFTTARQFNTHWIFLDPKAWEAIGKVEGWMAVCYICKAREGIDEHESICSRGGWSEESDENTQRWWMKQMVDDLFEGKSIEEFIKTL